VRLVGRRRAEARLDEPIVSIPSDYAKKPLLRSAEKYAPDERTFAMAKRWSTATNPGREAG
jgi:hypothetical protein